MRSSTLYWENLKTILTLNSALTKGCGLSPVLRGTLSFIIPAKHFHHANDSIILDKIIPSKFTSVAVIATDGLLTIGC